MRVYCKLEPQHEKYIMPSVRKWLWVVPSWCHSLRLEYSPGLEAAEAACTPDTKYRRAIVEFAPSFFSGTAEEQERLIVHELLHLALAPLTEFVDDALDRLEGDKALLQWLADQWEERSEGVVEDLRELVFQKDKSE